MNRHKITEFSLDEVSLRVEFVETLHIKDGVECDTYVFVGDSSKDLAIVQVQKGCVTPLQRVLLGTKTIEGFVAGAGVLTVHGEDGVQTHKFKQGLENEPVSVGIGQTMQWQANDSADLVFYEICEPPYADGRYENLSE